MSVEDVQGFRLSPQQRRGWSLWRGEGVAYGARCAMLLEGDLREDRLTEALRRVVDRHDILRTTFRSLPGMRFPVQVITENGSSGWSVGEETAELSPSRILDLLHDGEGFDLENGPVLRGRLLRAGEHRHILTLALPLLCADGMTVDNLVRDLARLYAGGSDDDAPIRYVQFSEWQNTLLEAEDDDGGREFWQRQQKDAASGVRFPFELPAGADVPYAPAAVPLQVGRELTAAAEALAARAGVDLGLVLLACWNVLLWRSTRSDDLAVAVLYNGRSHEMFEEALGPFARWLPVRSRPRPGLPFQELLQDLRKAMDSACEWGDAFERDDDKGFPAAFEFERWPEDVQADGVRFRMLGKYVCTDRSLLRLACIRRAGGLEAELHYDSAQVPAGDARRLLKQWACCLENAVASPEMAVEVLDILGEAERQRLLFDLNATARDYPRDACIHHLFEAQAERTPDAPAVVFEGRSLTFSELDRKANQLASHLRGLGVGPDVPVALCIDRSIEIVLAMLGVLKAGGAYVPLEPSQPQQRLTFLLEDVAPPVAVVQSGLESRLGAYPGRVVRIDADWEAISRESDARLDSGAGAGNLVYVIFTSGSTGRPKGVAVEHRQLVNYTSSVRERLELPAGASFANVSTFAADLGNTAIFPSLCTGGCLHVISLDRLSDARGVGDYFERHGIDCLKIVPSHMEALQDLPEPGRTLPRRRLVLGGEVSRPAWIEELQRRAPDCVIYNHYGPSETTVGVLTYRAEPGRVDPRCSSLPLGRPIANARVHILDPGLQPVPVWMPGELYIGGDGVSRGYLRRPDLTAERFVPDPFGGQPGARLYRTGDLARYLPDGAVEFLGRLDDQVKYHGFRIELNEIRLALNHVPQVRDSVVALMRDAGGRDVLVAYYVSRHELEVSQLRESLRQSILEETMPNLFVHLRRLPLTLNGKINNAALPSLEEARRMTKRELVAPRNPTEEVMVGIWAEVLGHERVSIHDNFFELGGHSLLATRVISRQREALDVELPLRSLFEAPTVAALAEVVQRLREEAGGRLEGPGLEREAVDFDRQLAELELLSDDEAGRLAQGLGSPDRGALTE